MSEGEEEVVNHKSVVQVAEPREIKLVKGPQGFGFNIRGQVSEGGQLKSIGGKLYAPLQYISAVLEGGPADEANIKIGDRVLEVNSVEVEGTDHHAVVQLIKRSGNTVDLMVISVTEDEKNKLEVDSALTPTSVEYYEQRSIPVSIPDSCKLKDEATGKEYVAFVVHMGGKKVAQRRYREFDALHTNLKKQFTDFLFPRLPGKWPFGLSDAQVDTRRRSLEDYLEKVCGIKVIFESDLIQDFLCSLQKDAPSPRSSSPVTTATASGGQRQNTRVEVRVQLPGGEACCVLVAKESPTLTVYQAVAKELGLSDLSRPFFALYHVVDRFHVKLGVREFPYHLYHSSNSTLFLRKWTFSTAHEAFFCQKDEVASDLIYQQAIEDATKRRVNVGNRLRDLQALQLQGKQTEYMKLMRSLPSHNIVSFPHCKCDARKDGHIQLHVSLTQLTLQACEADGTLLEQEHIFTWDMLKDHEAEVEEQAFIFRYNREGKTPRTIRVFSEYYEYIEECVLRAMEESEWPTPVIASGDSNGDNASNEFGGLHDEL